MIKRGRILDGGQGEPLVPMLQRSAAIPVPAWIGGHDRPPVRDAFSRPTHIDPIAEAERERQSEAARLDGERRALEAERARLAALQARYAIRVAELTSAANDATRPSGSAVVELALMVAHQIIKRESAIDPTLLAAAVDEGLAALAGDERIQVRLCGADLELVTAARPELADRAELICDDQLEPGGCVIESERSIIDRSLERRLDAVRAAIADVLEGQSASGEEAA